MFHVPSNFRVLNSWSFKVIWWPKVCWNNLRIPQNHHRCVLFHSSNMDGYFNDPPIQLRPFFLSASESQRRRLHPQRHRHRGGGSPWPSTTHDDIVVLGAYKNSRNLGKNLYIYIYCSQIWMEVFWGGHKQWNKYQQLGGFTLPETNS